jgi:hypothetical protein
VTLDPVVQAAVISGGIAVIAAIISFLVNRRMGQSQIADVDATASQRIAASSLTLIRPLQERIDELEKLRAVDRTVMTSQSTRLSELEKRNVSQTAELDGLRAGVIVLTSQLKRLGIAPEYSPGEQTPKEK